MKLSVFTTLTSLLSAAGLANAGYVFSTGVTDTFTATPGSPATVPIYLVEDSSSTGSLEAAGGLYSNAFTVSRSVGTAPLSTLAATSDFAAYDGYPYYTGDSAASMLADRGNLADLAGPTPDAFGRIQIATLTVNAASSDGTSQFDVVDYLPGSTINYAFEDLSPIAPAGFSVVSVVPEPASMSLLVVGGLAMLRKRRAPGSRHAQSQR